MQIQTHISSAKINPETQNAQPKTRVVATNSPDVFESMPTRTSIKALIQSISSLETLAHSIGENANESWIRIWNLKSQLKRLLSMCDAKHSKATPLYELMLKEVATIDRGLKMIQARR